MSTNTHDYLMANPTDLVRALKVKTWMSSHPDECAVIEKYAVQNPLPEKFNKTQMEALEAMIWDNADNLEEYMPMFIENLRRRLK